MARINHNYLKLPGSYLFSEIARRVTKFKNENPHADIIRLGIGDATQPLPPIIVEAMKRAADEMGQPATFRGYGPEQGYDFLKEKIAEYDFKSRGIEIKSDEIFISDGAKNDTGNFQELFSIDNVIALTDPVYPVYIDSNVMAGRTGMINNNGQFDKVVYLPCTEKNGMKPELPKQKVDMIYLCFPNNPTGITISKEELKAWVDYARKHRAIILFDAAYEAYIQEAEVPHSIFEIEGAREVAVEFRSYSKTAGFTGTRCAYTIVPHEAKIFDDAGNAHSLNSLWLRRQTTKFNGVSYPVQAAAAAIYSTEGQKQVKKVIEYYMENARIIKSGLEKAGYRVYGGVNSPYVWMKTPDEMGSWDYFDKLMKQVNVIGTPGAGFGASGEGYFRLTGFGSRESTQEAVRRITDNM